MTVQSIVLLLGWSFLLLSIFWPTKKWGGFTTRLVFSALSVGVFGTAMLYSLVK